MGAGTFIFLYNVYWTHKNAEQVSADDPWGFANSLEWATSCPPPRHNFTSIPRIRSERPAFDLHYPHIPPAASCSRRVRLNFPVERLTVQHERETLMSESYSLPTAPEGMAESLRERFNSGKVRAMMTLYEPEAVLIAKDGRTVTDHTEIAAELERDLSLGLPLEAKARHVFVAGDIAQIVLDWSIDGTGPDGEHVHLGGSASDVVRRGADGFWRYVIDNNQGTAVRQPA